mmetsp:Transcript_104658/g.295754  ORF Transcript_104658/g.295754 Transcript_104658/m.295754 type:complete len:81 (-) Transcript_104658:574-816(-)
MEPGELLPIAAGSQPDGELSAGAQKQQMSLPSGVCLLSFKTFGLAGFTIGMPKPKSPNSSECAGEPGSGGRPMPTTTALR